MKIKLEQGKYGNNDRKIWIDTEGFILMTLLQKLFLIKLFKLNEEWRWGNCDIFENALKDVLLDSSFEDIARRYWRSKTPPIEEAKKLDELWGVITNNNRKGVFKI